MYQSCSSKQDGYVEAGLITSLSHVGLGGRLTSMHISFGLNLRHLISTIIQVIRSVSDGEKTTDVFGRTAGRIIYIPGAPLL
jgi:hypothetical protein